MRWGSAVSAILAFLCVQPVVQRGLLRADLFSTVLSAAFVVVLWHYHQTGRGRLYWLPVLMVAWANLHLGFFQGFAIIGLYVIAELLEFPRAERRRQALARLRRGWPWLALCPPITFVIISAW
jgi:hypothetical protein